MNLCVLGADIFIIFGPQFTEITPAGHLTAAWIGQHSVHRFCLLPASLRTRILMMKVFRASAPGVIRS